MILFRVFWNIFCSPLLELLVTPSVDAFCCYIDPTLDMNFQAENDDGKGVGGGGGLD